MPAISMRDLEHALVYELPQGWNGTRMARGVIAISFGGVMRLQLSVSEAPPGSFFENPRVPRSVSTYVRTLHAALQRAFLSTAAVYAFTDAIGIEPFDKSAGGFLITLLALEQV